MIENVQKALLCMESLFIELIRSTVQKYKVMTQKYKKYLSIYLLQDIYYYLSELCTTNDSNDYMNKIRISYTYSAMHHFSAILQIRFIALRFYH